MKLPKVNMDAVTEVAKAASGKIAQASPALLVAAGTIGLVATAVMAWKASRKVEEDIDNATEEKAEEEEADRAAREGREPENGKLTKTEIVKATWKTMAPVVGVGIISVTCIIGGYTIKRHRMDALAAAATLSASQLKVYQEKVLETVGPKKEKEVRAAVAKEEVDKKFEQMSPEEEQSIPGVGPQLFYEPIQHALFYSDIERVRRIFKELNLRMMSEMYITLNELYDELNLPRSEYVFDDVGWSADDGEFEPTFEAIPVMDGRRTAFAIDYISKAPTYLGNRRFG